MAPRIRSSQIETRTQRAKLKVRRKLYKVKVSEGIHLGYRRNHNNPGTWSVACADGVGGEWIKKFAIADDTENADGKTVMDFWQACEEAKKLARAENGVTDGGRPVTVEEAIDDYKRDLVARDGNPDNATDLKRKLAPALLAKTVSLLTQKDVIGFRDQLVDAGLKKSSVNRYMNNFIAALNLAARRDDRIKNEKAWKVQTLPDARDDRGDVILADHQVHALIGAAYRQEYAWGLLVEVLAVTGTRISQAKRLNVSDLLPGDRLDMPVSKKGKGTKAQQKRLVPITSGLAAKLRAHAIGRRPGERLLVGGDGKPWGIRCESRRFPASVNAAGLGPEVTSYALRHSSIVRQLLNNVPSTVVAMNHDTSVEEIENHYAKYITNHSDALTRKALLAEPLHAANDNIRAAMTG